MSTVEQTRDALHPSLKGPFEDAVLSVIARAAEQAVWRQHPMPRPIHIARSRAARAVSDEIWEMDIGVLLDVADTDIADLIADILH